MGDFRSFKTAQREPAAPMKPLTDPAGWTAADLRDVSRWSYPINAADAGELEAAVAAVRRNGVAMVDIRKGDFPLKAFADVLTDVRRELMDGRGIVMMQDFPLDRFDREGTAIAYIGLGAHLGQTMSQNKLGHILGHVKDLGGDYNDANTRGYMTNAEMRFHTDACDYVRLALPADADVGRRQPDRELGDGLQHDAATQARAGRGAVRRLLPLPQRRGQPRRSAVFQAADFLVP